MRLAVAPRSWRAAGRDAAEERRRDEQVLAVFGLAVAGRRQHGVRLAGFDRPPGGRPFLAHPRLLRRELRGGDHDDASQCSILALCVEAGYFCPLRMDGRRASGLFDSGSRTYRNQSDKPAANAHRTSQLWVKMPGPSTRGNFAPGMPPARQLRFKASEAFVGTQEAGNGSYSD